MAQANKRSLPTAWVPNSHLCHSTWVSWWTKRGLGRFSRGSPFPLPQISFNHFSTLISFILFSSAPVMMHQVWLAGTLGIHRPWLKGFITSHPSIRLCVRHKLDFMGEETESGQFFLGYFQFNRHKFHSTISPQSSDSFHVTSFYPLL